MSTKRISWVITFLIAFFITGCGTDTKDQLKPPSVYKNPQVKVTHAPTQAVADIPPAEATALATQQVVSDAQDDELTDEEEDQFLTDEIESLLNEVEGKLDRMDTNINP